MQSKPQSPGTDKDDGEVTSLDTAGLADALRDALNLRYPPVAMAFVSSAPAGIETFAGEVPSACSFWRHCEERVFYAPADAHFNCAVGALTMGFSMPPTLTETLMGLVGNMGEIGYLDPEEAGNIPSVPGEKTGIVYGPLSGFPLDPDMVLLWVSGTGAMLLDEATGASRWTPERTGTASFGRPSCAAVAVSASRGTPTFSVGCSGMRTFTEIDDDLELAVLPRPVLAGLRERLEATVRANAQMAEYYQSQKARFAPAGVAGGT